MKGHMAGTTVPFSSFSIATRPRHSCLMGCMRVVASAVPPGHSTVALWTVCVLCRRDREGLEGARKKGKGGAAALTGGRKASVLTETEGHEATYRPRHRESKKAYEEILSLIQTSLGDQPHDILRGAADEILHILKDQNLTDPKRQVEVEKLLRRLPQDKFHKLVGLGKQIHDFKVGGAEDDKDDSPEQEVDEEVGVAVVFDEDDDEEDESDIDEVRDDEDEEVRMNARVSISRSCPRC
jgi:hypothetical protein